MATELRDVIRLARQSGFQVQQAKRGHWIFRDPKGRRVATASSSPSDYRSLKNTVAHLRAAGLNIPRK